MLPLLLGKARPSLPLAQARRCSRSTDKTIGGTNWPSCGPRARCRRGDTRSGKAFVSQCATETPCGDTQRQKALQQNAQFVLNRAASRRPAASVCRASQADRAVLERAGSREPANRGLAHTVGARQIGLHSPVGEPPEGLFAGVSIRAHV